MHSDIAFLIILQYEALLRSTPMDSKNDKSNSIAVTNYEVKV